MADPTTEIASPAADAPAVTPTPETTPAPMTLAESRAALTANTPAMPQERDPLLDPEAPDPLFAEDSADPLLTGASESEVAAPDESPAAEPEVTPEVAPTPAAEASPEEDDEGRKRLNINRRVRNPDGSYGDYIHTPRERRVMRHSADNGISLAEAEKELFGDAAPATPDAAKPAAEAPKAKTSAEIKTEIATLRQQRKVAAGAYDRDKEMEITEQIEELTTDFAAASFRETQAEQTAKSQEQQAQSAFVQAEADSFDEVKTKFPEAWVAGSELNTAVWAEIRRMETAQPNFKSDPDWPFTLAARVAARKGIPPAKAAVVATAKPAIPQKAVAAAPARRATPVPAPGAVSGATPALSPIVELSTQIQEAKGRGDLRALRTLQAKIDGLDRRAA